MSYIEKKYKNKILEIFQELANLVNDIIDLLKYKSIKNADKIAKLCALCNKNVNQITRIYYPEIKEMNDKLDIKSSLKFYYDLIDKLTDFIRNVETFQKLDEKYYDNLIKFLNSKDNLISEKYRKICTNELTAFYDPNTRQNLEKILAEKIEKKNREFFSIGPLEEEIRKIGKIAGAEMISILNFEEMRIRDFKLIENPRTIIHYTIFSQDEQKLKFIGKELKQYLNSKGYEAVVLILELNNLATKREVLAGSIITDAKLLSDN
ncbi:MAG: hypothetical protein ACFFA8_12815 [Promethearchaeota archaeon]